jgi:hypothetical protein
MFRQKGSDGTLSRMRALLVRVGIDQEFGRWNSPIDLRSRRFVYVPIPENQEPSPQHVRLYDELLPALRHFSKKFNCKDDSELPKALIGRPMHLDPDFEYLTYGDNGNVRGAKVKCLAPKDLIVFYAGLRAIGACEGLCYAIVGLYVVRKIVMATDVPRDRWMQNAHTRKVKIGKPDIIVRAHVGQSGRLENAIPIGEWRNRAYRVTEELLERWGGLDVKDGFIQRSVTPPSFLNPKKFYNWFLRQGVKLVERNN